MEGQEKSSKTLICMVGLPYSGKTIWALRQGVPVVSPDSIRLALHGQRFLVGAERFVWAIAHVMVESLFLAGHDFVILDACNNSRKRRDEWKSDKWELRFQVMDAGVSLCVQRALANDDAEILSVIDRMSNEHEPLGPDEKACMIEPILPEKGHVI